MEPKQDPDAVRLVYSAYTSQVATGTVLLISAPASPPERLRMCTRTAPGDSLNTIGFVIYYPRVDRSNWGFLLAYRPQYNDAVQRN